MWRINMNIKVLGPGCMNCQTLEKRTMEAVKNLNIEAEIEKVTDYTQILSYGIVKTPGLLINSKIAVQSKVPTVEQLQEILVKHIN
jgi:small redox-active disulfide protein 2